MIQNQQFTANKGTEKDLLDPKESMRVIRQVIDVAKKSAQEDGFHTILGGIVPVSALTEWYLWRSTDFGAPWVVWGDIAHRRRSDSHALRMASQPFGAPG